MPHASAFKVENCYPYIVTKEYIEGRAGEANVLPRPIGHGLFVVLVQEYRGVVKSVSQSDLTAANLTADSAYDRAVHNLDELLASGAIEIRAYESGPNNLPFILVSEHWASAACILLPAILGIARENLGSNDIIASIPHRDVMLLFPRAGKSGLLEIQKFVVENENEGRNPLTFEPFELTENGPVPVVKTP